MIEAFITNVGKYAEGELCGDWLTFPTTKEAVQSLLSRIGVDGISYEEYFITDFRAGIFGICGLSQYASINELNYLASLVSEKQDFELEKFEAAVVHGDRSGSVKDLINLAQNDDRYEFYPGVNDYDELGRYLIDELDYEEIPEGLENYFDYESYARDYVFNTGGRFCDSGFVFRNSVTFEEHYNGKDIPDEYRVFAYPDPPERRQNMDNTKTGPLMDNEHVKELLELLESNNMPGVKNLLAVIGQVSTMEKHLSNMVTQLESMREELAEAQRQNHPIKNAMQKAVIAVQNQALHIRDRLNALKQDIIGGCKTALEAFQDKGLSALRNVADFIKLRPCLEALQKDIDKSIRQDEAAIKTIETISKRYHEAGRNLKNAGRALAGKEAIQDAKPIGKVAKAFIDPIRADLACCKAMRGCVAKAIGAVERLEKTERKPSIKETIDRHNREIAQAGRDAPARERVAPEHADRKTSGQFVQKWERGKIIARGY